MDIHFMRNGRLGSVWLAITLGGLVAAQAQTNFTILRSFTAVPDGTVCFAGLVADTNGVLYGTTFIGGISNKGTVFSIQQDGTSYTKLHDFLGADGGGPYAPLIIATNGSLYGTTYGGGTSNFGTVFTINRDGSGFSPLHSFTGGTDGETAEGDYCRGATGCCMGLLIFSTPARGERFTN